MSRREFIEMLESRSLLSSTVLDSQNDLTIGAPADITVVNEYTTTGPLDINGMVATGKATITATQWDGGKPADVFDGKTSSLYRTPNIDPAFIRVAFANPKTLREFRAYFSHAGGNPAYQWKIETADTQGDMDTKTGSYREVVPWTGTASDAWSTKILATPVTARIVRLTATRLTGDNYIHINELAFIGDTTITNLAVEPATSSMQELSQKPFKAIATDADGAVSDYTSKVTWSTGDEAIATVDAAGIVRAKAAGQTNITATLGTLSSTSSLTVTPYQTQQVDLNVTYIERLPRYNYDAAKNNPAPGDLVTFRGHVRNWSNWTPQAEYWWLIDGQVVERGVLSDLLPDEERVLERQWTWQGGDHQVKLVVDPYNEIVESSEVNNFVDDRTNGLAVGFWVEQSLYDYFHANQKKLGIGSNSWEDWAQRQMRKWNEHNVNAVHPVSPLGVTDRVRIDKITVVPDDALPLNGGLSGNNPDSRDKTPDMVWGFPWNPNSTFYANHTSLSPSNPFHLEPSLIHEMGHARYLIDNYTYDVHNLSSHASVQIMENGQPVAGSALMPFIAFGEVLYYNQYGGIMTGPWRGWSPHEAGALNRIAGLRARCGNMNAPCNLGEYINDRPQNNHVRFTNAAGQPLVGADVRVYQATTGPGYGGKTFDNTPDLFYTTDASGYAHLPQNPFVSGAIKELIFRVEHNGNVWYRFFEAAAMNIEYWKGNTLDAKYTIALPTPGSPQEIAVYGYETEIADGDTTPSPADHTDFGSVDVNGGSVTRQFVVKNLGATRLRTTGSRATIVGAHAADFTLLSVPGSVDVGALSTFQVKFDPKAPGLRRATIRITSEDADEGVYEFDVQGVGVGTPFATLSGGTLLLTDTPGDDRLSVSWNAGKVQVMFNDLVQEFAAPVTGIQFAAGTGDDSFSFNGAPGSTAINFVGNGIERYFLNSGSLVVPGFLSGFNGDFEVGGNAHVAFGQSQVFQSLRLHGSGAVELAPGGGKLFDVNALSIEDDARLDLQDNEFAIDTDAATRDGVLAAVHRWIASARNATKGPWLGNGITSSAAANDPLRGLASGIVDDHVWIKYTYNGDANLDGRITSDDYFRIDSGFLKGGGGGWRNGDFNYDGTINSDDYFLIDSAFLGQGEPLDGGGVAGALQSVVVPEPASLALALAPLLLLGRRRRA